MPIIGPSRYIMPTIKGSDTLNFEFPVVQVNGETITGGGTPGIGGPIHSAEIVGNGTAQTWPHGLGAIPASVVVHPTQWPGGSPCASSYTTDATNIYVTMTYGVTYVIYAWAPIV